MITPSYNITATQTVLPKLALDFTTASLDPRVTLTRAGATATRVNSSGLIETVAADTPRFDFDPVALVCRGLLIEEQRTNLIFHSGAVGDTTKSWGLNNCTAVLNAVVAPDGTLSGTEITSTLATGEVRPRQDARAITAGTNIAFSCFFKVPLVSGLADPTVRLFIRTRVGGSVAYSPNKVEYNFLSGTFTLLGSAILSAAAVPAGNGWVKVCGVVNGAANTETSTNLYLNLSNGSTNRAPVGAKMFYWGAQIEEGSFPTSYIPTEATAVTRNADVSTMTGTNFSDWFNASQGTLCATGTTFNGQGTASYANALFAVTDNVNDFCCLNRYVNAASGTVRNGGVTQASFSVADGWLSGETHSAAIAYKDADFGYALDGVSEAPVASGSIPAGVDRAYIGRSFDGSDFRTWNGHVLELSYYPQRLTDAELAAITA